MLIRYGIESTRVNAIRRVQRLFADRSASDLTTEEVRAHCLGSVHGRPPANNTIRGKAAIVEAFWGWLADQGYAVVDVTPVARALRKSFPQLYGAQQTVNPPRWLSHDDAIVRLIGACRDGTWHGSRDQLIIRWGLLSVRSAEILGMTWGAEKPDGAWRWIGKGHRPRSAMPGPVMAACLASWRRAYERGLGRPVRPSDPVICRCDPHGNIVWGRGVSANVLRRAVLKRCDIAALGHVTVHDLRRTCAGLLHNDRGADGGHRWDLSEIQRILDHARPDVTVRSYLEPLATERKADAGRLID
ncbi:MAG: tyrosine-type recombinase/integrase [Acidimicrobiales bacterium]